MIVTNEIVLEQPKHIYREIATGAVLPGVTTILKVGGFIDDRFYNDTARDRGTAAHLAIHFLEKGTLDPFSIDPIVEPYVDSYVRWKEVCGYQVLYHEKLVYHPVYRYAGSLDSVGLLNGCEIIVDFKTGDIQPWAGLQLAAYDACLPKPSTNGLRKRFGLRLFGDGSIGRLEPFEDRQEAALFFGNVADFYWKLKHGNIKYNAEGELIL